MLGLGAVDIHRVGVSDGDHEHGCVGSGLLTLVVVLAPAATSISAVAVGIIGGSRGGGNGGDGLEVGEDGVVFRLAWSVGGGGCHTVVLRDEVESYHVSWLRGDGLWGEGELIVCANCDHHCGGRGGHGLGQDCGEESTELHV